MTEEMIGILPRAVQDLLNCTHELNGEQIKVSLQGRYGFLKNNQTTLSLVAAPFVPVLNRENFTNKVMQLTTEDPLAHIKTMLIQFRVEKMVTNEHTDVNYLSIYRFPSLDAYKSVIKVAKQESEHHLRVKLVNTVYKPNKLQLLGVLAHQNLSGVSGSSSAPRRNPSSDSKGESL